MAQRENGKSSREEYRRVQERKKRQIEKQRMYAEQDDNVAKSGPYKKKKVKTAKESSQRRRSAKYDRKQSRKAQRGSVARGIGLLVLQVAATILFMGVLFWLDMLTTEYLAIAGCVLVVFIGITLLTQLSSKNKRIGGKVFSVLITCVLIVGSYYLMKMNNMLGDVAGSNYKVDNMVVAVLKSDSAENIQDASDYKFGVQYKKDTAHMEAAVQAIDDEVNHAITTEDLGGLSEQANALKDGDVQAIVYNEVYAEVMKQAFDDYDDEVKIIYEHGIKTDLKDLTIDVSVQDEPFAVYLSGIDVYGDVSKNSRSDVNIIAVVNPKSHQILLITTPRDYYVPIPHVSGEAKDKLTHAGLYGVDASKDTLGQLYEMKIPFHARVNFSSLIKIVDTLGGIDVDSSVAFRTGKATGHVMDVKKGINHLNGKEALAFSRERHYFLEGDNQRGENQEKVIVAMIKKMISPTIIVKANSIMDTLGKNVETNMTPDQIKSLIKQQLRENATWKIASVSAKGEGLKTTCFSMGSQIVYVTIPDEQSVAEIIELVNRVEKGETLEDSVVAEAK